MAKPVEAQVHLTLVDRLTAPLRRIQARMAAMSRRLGIDRIARATSDLTRRIGGLGAGLAATGRRLGLFTAALGLGGAGAIMGTFRLAQNTATLGDEIAKTSRQLGLGAEALQEYRYAAELSGVASGTFDQSVERLGRNAVMAADGNKAISDSFRRMGVSVRDANGNMRSTEAILDDVMAALAAIEDPMVRNQRAYELFGRSGVDMAKMVAEGTDALRASREEARRTGHVISQTAAEFGEVFGDNVTRLTKRLEGLRNMLGVHLMPVMNEIVERTTAWVDANQGLIRSTIADWTKRFSNLLRDLMDPLSDVRQSIAEFADQMATLYDRVRPVIDFLGGPGQATMIALAAYITGPLITAVALLGAAFIKLGLVILSTPIGWIVTVMAAAIYVLIKRWDDFVDYWANLWTRITDAFEEGWVQGVVAVFAEFNPLVHVARGINAIIEYFTGISLIDEGSALIQSFWDGMKAVGLDVAGWLRGLFDQAIDYLASLPAEFFNMGANIITGLWDGLKSVGGSVTGWLSDTFSFGGGQAPAQGGQGDGKGWFNLGAPAAPEPPAVRSLRIAPPALAPMSLPVPSAAPDVKTDTVQAGNVEAQNMSLPDPLMVREPQSIDASTRIENMTVQGGQGTPAEIRAAVSSALAEQSRRQSAAVQSSLND